MDKQDIINYVLETPTNTNPAVLSGMLDSLDGRIEMITLFDDDVSGFTYTPSSQYGPAVAQLGGTIVPISTVGDGVLKISYEGMHKFTILSDNNYSVTINSSESTLNLPFTTWRISSYYDPVDSCIINMYGKSDQEAEFEAYCQEPHHLKVEWFTI